MEEVMEKYKIMIVDDEADVREGIASHINWDKLNMEVVALAENGQDGLDKAENCEVDIVLTDIKMPFLGGLEMSRLLLKLHPYCKIIILTGFDEFEYAQSAIRLNAAEYVLKPVNVIELTEVLQRVKEVLDESIAEKRNMDSLRKSYAEALPVLKGRFLSNLLAGFYEEKKLEEQMESYDVKIRGYKYYSSVVFEITGVLGDKPSVSMELINLSVHGIIQDCFESRCGCEVIMESFGIAAITGWDKEQVDKIMSITNEVCQECRHILDIEVTAGIGRVRQGIHEVHSSFREAREALEYKIIIGGGGAIYIQDMEQVQPPQIAYDSRSEKLLLSAIKFGSSQQLSTLISDMLDRISNYDEWGQRVYLLNFINSIYNIVKGYNLQNETLIAEPLKELMGGPVKWATKESFIKKDCYTICYRISSCISQKRENAAKLLITEAKKYIEDHYRESDLSVEKICGSLHVSQSYFSTLFRKETGVSYVQYLTEIRMTNALMLLQETDYKTYIISDMVGYDDPNYFSHVFKRRFGISPIKYRQQA
jgi:two-component system response regulator YesN